MSGGEIHVVKEYLDIFPPPTAGSVSNVYEWPERDTEEGRRDTGQAG